MVFSNVYIGFDALEKVLNLPDGVKIVAVRDSENQGQFAMIRIVSAEAPQEITFNRNTDPLSKIGEAYLPQLAVLSQQPEEPSRLVDEDLQVSQK